MILLIYFIIIIFTLSILIFKEIYLKMNNIYRQIVFKK